LPNVRIAFTRLTSPLLMLLAFLAVTSPARAQVPSVLEEVKLVTEDDRQASFLLRFSPREPDFAPINGNPSQPALSMRLSLRAPRVAEQASYRGIVRTTRLTTGDGNLLMRFDTVAPAKVTAEKVGALTVKVTVERVSEAEATGIQPIGSAGDVVVPASDLAPTDYYNPSDSYELVFLKYADVSEIIGLLVEGTTIEPNNVFIRREPGFGSPGANAQISNYSNANVVNDKKDRPLGQSFGNGLAIDRRLNAIWVRGTPERIASIKAQIAMIDVPVDSVILETQFVELSEQGARNLGIDFTNSAGQIAVGTLTTGSNLPFGTDPNRVLPSGALQAAIYAQVQKGQGRIVSRPRIAALSGSTAKIITGDAIPILTSILSGLNAVSQQVQYVNVGVTLQIAPRVSSDGFVTSQIYGVVSSVTGTSQGYPTISQREAETSASVRDGETFVIGGLTQENNLTNKSKVPLFGDIPLVGNLFKVEKSTRSKTELYIVITPHIVRHRRFEQSANDVPGAPSAAPAAQRK
jgi:general secretion pathway protein D